MNYKTQKQNLLNRIEKLMQYSEIDEKINSHLNSLKEEIINDLQFNVLCTGEFSAGKSTFINRFFIKKDVLPTKATETTAKLTFIKYSNNEKIVIHYMNKKEEIINEVNEGILEEYLAKDGNKIKEVDYVEVFINSEVLKEGIAIIDSPGLNAPENERVNLTNEFIPKTDAVLYLMTALQAWKGSEKEFLENKILNKEDLDKIFFLINYWDVLDEGEGKDVLEYVKDEMLKSLEVVERDLGEVSVPPIIPISAKTGYNFDKLEEELINYLSSKKGIDILNQKIEKFENLKKKIIKLIDKKIELNKKDKITLKQELEEIQKELKALKIKAKEYKKSLYSKVENIVHKWLFNIESLYKEFAHNIISKLQRTNVKLDELESTIKKIVINQSNYLQKRLNIINRKFFRELEELAEEEKAKLDLEEYFIKKESSNIYDLEKELKTEIKRSKVIDYLPEISTTIGVGTAATSLFIGIASTGILLTSLPIIGGGVWFYFKKQQKLLEKSKENLEEVIESFIEEKISELYSKKEDIIDSIIDNIKNEILQTYEVKEKEYKKILEKNNKDEIEKLKKLKKEIEKI